MRVVVSAIVVLHYRIDQSHAIVLRCPSDLLHFGGIEAVDQIVFEQAAPFFRDSLNPRGATFAVKTVIEKIVAGQKPELTGNQSRFLIRRGLITADGTLAFPILGRWLNEYAE